VIHIDIAYLHQQLYTCATLQINCQTCCLTQLCCDNALTGCCPDYLGLHLSSILYGVIYQHYLNYCFATFGSKILVSYHYMIFANKIVSTQNWHCNCQIGVTKSVLVDNKITSCNINGCSSLLTIMLFIRSILRDQQSSLGKISLHNVTIYAAIFSRAVHFAKLQMWTFNN